MEDWALIRRLVADGVPRRQVARQLGIGRSTVARAVASDVPPKYERRPAPTSFSPFEVRVRALLAEFPELPATVIAERVEWPGSISWFRENVGRLRPVYRRPDPADRLSWAPGDAAQCDLWFPPSRIPLEDGSTGRGDELVADGSSGGGQTAAQFGDGDVTRRGAKAAWLAGGAPSPPPGLASHRGQPAGRRGELRSMRGQLIQVTFDPECLDVVVGKAVGA